MPGISRRELLASGFAISAATLVGNSTWAKAAELLGSDVPTPATVTGPSISPREHLLFDFGWRFSFGHGWDPSKDLGVQLWSE